MKLLLDTQLLLWAGGDAGDLAVQAAAVEAAGAQSLRDGEHHLSVRYRRDLRDDRAPRAVLAREVLVLGGLQALQMIRHQSKQRRRLRAPGLWAPRAVGAASGMRAPGPGSAERTVDSGTDHHRSVARWAVSTQRLRGAGLTVLAVAERTDHSRSVKRRAARRP